jgi:hypothetical protein
VLSTDLSLRVVRISILQWCFLPSLNPTVRHQFRHAIFNKRPTPPQDTPVQTVLVSLMCYQLTMTEIFVACGHTLVRQPYVTQPQNGFYLTRTTVSSTVTVLIACEVRTIPAKPTVARPSAYNCTPNSFKSTIRFSYFPVLHPHSLSRSNIMVIAQDAATEPLRPSQKALETLTPTFLVFLHAM